MSRTGGPIQHSVPPTDNRSDVHSEAELRYLAIGQITRAHGVRGEVSVAVLTDFPERFETIEWIHLGNEFEAVPYRLEKYRWHKKQLLLTLSGVTDRSQAERLNGLFIQVPIEEAIPLPEGSYYQFQLIGLQVKAIDGQFLGTVADIMETGANDVYVIQNNDHRQILLPAIPDVVKSVDVEDGQMIVELIDGLI